MKPRHVLFAIQIVIIISFTACGGKSTDSSSEFSAGSSNLDIIESGTYGSASSNRNWDEYLDDFEKSVNLYISGSFETYEEAASHSNGLDMMYEIAIDHKDQLTESQLQRLINLNQSRSSAK